MNLFGGSVEYLAILEIVTLKTKRFLQTKKLPYNYSLSTGQVSYSFERDEVSFAFNVYEHFHGETNTMGFVTAVINSINEIDFKLDLYEEYL